MNKNIENIFKEKFEQFEAPVSDGLWDKIQENPSWKKHLRKQKVTNLTIYGILAVCFISVCTILIIKHNQQNTAFPEITITEKETLSDDTQESVTPAIHITKSETSDTVAVESSEEQVESVRQNTATEAEATPTLPLNGNSTIPEPSDIQSITPSQIPSVPQSDKMETPTPTPAVQENKNTKTGDDSSSEATSAPSSSESDNTNLSPFSIPNAFTPNGDGLNDIFRPVTAASITQYQLDIFMVNGQRVFSSKDLEYGWNGEYQGKNMNGGTYIYIIKYKDADGKEHIDKGQLLLIR